MKYLSVFATYFAAVLSSVMAVEAAVGAEVPGTGKAQIVLDSLTAGASAVGQTIPDPTVQMISTLITAVVGGLNASGIFTHKSAPPAA